MYLINDLLGIVYEFAYKEVKYDDISKFDIPLKHCARNIMIHAKEGCYDKLQGYKKIYCDYTVCDDDLVYLKGVHTINL